MFLMVAPIGCVDSKDPYRAMDHETVPRVFVRAPDAGSCSVRSNTKGKQKTSAKSPALLLVGTLVIVALIQQRQTAARLQEAQMVRPKTIACNTAKSGSLDLKARFAAIPEVKDAH